MNPEVESPIQETDLEESTASQPEITLKLDGEKITIVEIDESLETEIASLIKDIPRAAEMLEGELKSRAELQALIEQDEKTKQELTQKLEEGDWKVAEKVALLESKLKSYGKALSSIEAKIDALLEKLAPLTDRAEQIRRKLAGHIQPLLVEVASKDLIGIIVPESISHVAVRTIKYRQLFQKLNKAALLGSVHQMEESQVTSQIRAQVLLLNQIKKGPYTL